MRVVVTGATGNVGTSLIESLAVDDSVQEIIGVARRRPEWRPAKTTWIARDITETDLVDIFRRADAVVHLAWLIQPSRDTAELWKTNVVGSETVFRAAIDAGVRTIVYASSVGAYSPGLKDRLVDESWPTHGIEASMYSRHKAYVERILDRVEAERPEIRVVRLRPALTFKRESASSQRRLFAGPLLPGKLLRPGVLRVFPYVSGLLFQALHTEDAAAAYHSVLTSDVRGAFNVAADPVLSLADIAQYLRARRVRVPVRLVRGAVGAAWRLHLQPSEPGWVDLAAQSPLLDASRIRGELGWRPRHDAMDTVGQLLDGIADRAGKPTPPLDPKAGGPLRVGEIATGVGSR